MTPATLIQQAQTRYGLTLTEAHLRQLKADVLGHKRRLYRISSTSIQHFVVMCSGTPMLVAYNMVSKALVEILPPVPFAP